jgi:two-component system, OmpR family, sensor histidine kinase KdpD
MSNSAARGLTTVWHAAAGIVIVAAITFLGSRVLPVNATTVGFFYLIAILFLATRWGLTEAVVASVVAVLCFNFFFLPPVGTFTIQDPQNWTALLTFLITAIVGSRLSAMAKRQALQLLDKQQEMERLYSLSRAMLLIEPAQPVAKQVANNIAQAFNAASVVLYTRADRARYQAGPSDFPGLNDQLHQAALEGTQFHNDRNWIVAIRLGGEPVGSIGISGVELSDSAVQSLANLAAIGLERARAQEAATKAEVARQSNELKSMLLDAIAHEFQTPLTTMKAATSALLAARPPDALQQAELVHLVDEETERLSSLVSDAIQMARIEAGSIHPHPEETSAADLVNAVLQQKRSALADRQVIVNIPTDLPALRADRELVTLALRQLIDNAAKYSDAAKPIEICARVEASDVILAVRDYGQGIPESEATHIFEKFYRGRQSSGRVAGSGLGLAVARAVVNAHEGNIWAESPEGGGTRFQIALPFYKQQPVLKENQ